MPPVSFYHGKCFKQFEKLLFIMFYLLALFIQLYMMAIDD